MQKPLSNRFTKLENTRTNLFSELEKLDSSTLNWKPAPGKWSILQVLQHLFSSEKLALNYVRKKMQDPSRAGKAGMMGRFRVTALQSAFNIPLRYKAPKALESFPDQSEPADIFNQYNDVRAQWAEQLEAIGPELLNKELFKHQLVGRMSLVQALDFFQSHFEHHMKQIERVRKAHKAVATA